MAHLRSYMLITKSVTDQKKQPLLDHNRKGRVRFGSRVRAQVVLAVLNRSR